MRKASLEIIKITIIYESGPFFSSVRNLKKKLPYLSIICSDINYIDGVLLVATSYRMLQMQMDLMCHLSPTFMFHSPSDNLMYSIFLLLLCSKKIVKVSQLQAFRYSIFNCFLIDFKSFVRKLDKEVDGNLCVNMPMY